MSKSYKADIVNRKLYLPLFTDYRSIHLDLVALVKVKHGNHRIQIKLLKSVSTLIMSKAYVI